MGKGNKSQTSKSSPMTKTAVSRIQSAEARKSGGKVSKGSFTSRAQRASEGNTSKKK
jgi:hypothetical protein